MSRLQNAFTMMFCLVFSISLIPGMARGADEHTNAWQPTEYVWNLGIASMAAIGPDKDPRQFFARWERISPEAFNQSMENVKAGDIIWIKTSFLPYFYKEVLPKLRTPIVMIISDGDPSFPSGCSSEVDIEKMLSNEYITKVFAQNCDYKGPSNKVSQLPLGMDFHTIAFSGKCLWGESGSPAEQEAVLNEIIQNLEPTHCRKKRAYVDFQLNDTVRHGDCQRYLEVGEDRTTIFNRLLPTGLLDFSKTTQRRSDLWRMKGQYAFSISPHGNGLDCHRTWEDLALGCIVIVKTSPLDPLYTGLPVVIVKDWDEVTEQNLDKWLEQYKDAFTNPSYREKLTNAYWMDKIKAAAINARQQAEKTLQTDNEVKSL